MKEQFTSMKASLLGEIRAHTERGDLAAIALLGPKLIELTNMEKQLSDLEHRISNFNGQGASRVTTAPLPREIPYQLSSYTSPHASYKREQTRLKLTIQWSALGKTLPDEILADRFANITQARFLGRLLAQLGAPVLHQLKEFSKSQGGRMHVSENPTSDSNFINKVNGQVYAHKPIPGTNLYLLTNTSTDEKKEDLELFLIFARLPLGAFKIEVVEK